jgi:glycosyltransferase involved in cell wall biosynthesis
VTHRRVRCDDDAMALRAQPPAQVHVFVQRPCALVEPADGRERVGANEKACVRTEENVARLVEALALIPDAVLVVPGYRTARDDDLARLAERVGVAGRLRRPGWVDEPTLDGLYRAADCFLFPSLAEGFGLPVLEAMIRGAPVACSTATSLPEIAGEAALFFDPLDVEAIAVSARRILEDRDLADRLRAAGYERARRFSWEECARRTLASYRKALAR